MNTETAIKPRRQIRGQEVWAQFIAAQPGSELSVDAYCRLHKLSPSGFYTWRQRLKQKPVPPVKRKMTSVAEPALAKGVRAIMAKGVRAIKLSLN